MAKPFEPKEIVSVEELVISNMLEIEALRQLLLERGVITKEEFIAGGLCNTHFRDSVQELI